MTDTITFWGVAPSDNYERLATRFRPIFARIAAGAVEREQARTLPYEPIRWLKEAGFGAIRVPIAFGGLGATLPELFALLIELATADSNIPQALRGHFALVEDILNSQIAGRREKWLPRFVKGDIAGNAWTELDAKITGFSATFSPARQGWTLNGTKFYTTGSLFADWIHVGGVLENGDPVSAIVNRNGPGVEVVDDWDGFGQTLTASGTTYFHNAAVDQDDVVTDNDRFKYSQGFYQLIQLATLSGIGRALANEGALAVARRQRAYSNGNAPYPRQDPQVLQLIGQIRAAAYGAGAVALQAARTVQKAYDALQAQAEDADHWVALEELDVAQAHSVIPGLVLNAATLVFDALGASALRKDSSLDRHWRNARALASHNPRIYKERIIGDYAVNGVLPPEQWRIGRPE